MAWIVGDGFDYYNVGSDMARSVWDSITANPQGFSTGRLGIGQSIQFGGASAEYMVKSFANESVIFVQFAVSLDATFATRSYGFTLYDGATAQCSVNFDKAANALVIRSGGVAGTILASYPAPLLLATWEHWQIKVVVGTAGSFSVRRNGALTETTLSGFSTKVTANDFANSIRFNMAGSQINSWMDDLLVFSGSGAAPNNWLGDVRAICLPVQKETSSLFSVVGSTSFTFGGTNPQSGAFTVSTTTGTAYCCNGVQPTRSGELQKIRMFPGANATGNFKMALYDSDPNTQAPRNLIAVSNEVVNLTLNASTDFTFPAGTMVSQWMFYWFGFIGSVNVIVNRDASAVAKYYTLAATYAAGFPASFAAATLVASSTPHGLATLIGHGVVLSEPLMNSDTDYVFSSTVGQEELMTVTDLPVTPLAIHGVYAKTCVKKSDAATRQGQVRVRSGATDVNGVDTVLTTNYTWLSALMVTDPATSVAWTPAGINALLIGTKVTL